MLNKILKLSIIIIIAFAILLPLSKTSLAATTPTTPAPQGQSIWQSASGVIQKMKDGTVDENDIKTLIEDLIRFLLVIVVFFGVIFLIVGGYQYITSAGNPDQIQKAKSTILYSITGIAVAGLAEAIVRFAQETATAAPPSVQDLIISIINRILIFAALLGVLFLIVGGYQYITSAGNPDQIKRAKNTITGAIAGLVVVLLSWVIATFVYNQAHGKPLGEGLLRDFINAALGFTTLTAVLFLIVGGYQYMTSAGNPDQIQKAKNTILYSVIGLVVILLSYVIVKFVINALGIHI